MLRKKQFYIIALSLIALSIVTIVSFCKKNALNGPDFSTHSNDKQSSYARSAGQSSVASTDAEKSFVDEWIKRNLSPESEWTSARYIPEFIAEDRRKINPSSDYWRDMNMNNVQRFKDALLIMERTESGRLLLELIQRSLARRSAKMNISVVSGAMFVIPLVDGPTLKRTDPIFQENIKKSSNGVGIVPFVCFDWSLRGDFHWEGLTVDQSYNVSVFHELVHAYHALIGESTWVEFSKNHFLAVSPTMYEEARTVGLGRFREEEISENKYREDLKLPRRTKYACAAGVVNDDDTMSLYGSGQTIPIPFPFAKPLSQQ